jgi:hypothetical protein
VQCRFRWACILDPPKTVIRRKWTPEEDVKLIQAVEKLGKNWVAVVTALHPGRNNLQCRTRWLNRLELTLGGTTAHSEVKGTPGEDAITD